MIPVSNRQRRVAVTAADVRRVVVAAYDDARAGDPAVSVALVDDATISRLNAEYLGHEGPTDTIAFPLDGDPSPDGVRGEVVVSAETAARVAAARGEDARRELLLYVVHGTLHLLGWDDDTPARRTAMNRRAGAILRRAGVERRS